MGIAQRNAGEKPISMVTKFYQMKFFEKCPASAMIESLNMFALLLSIQLFKKFYLQEFGYAQSKARRRG
jgi:hypothetical protein